MRVYCTHGRSGPIGEVCLAAFVGLATVCAVPNPAGADVVATYRFGDTGLGLPSNKSIDGNPANVTFSDFVVVGLTENTDGKEVGFPNSGWLATQEWETGRPGLYNDEKYTGFTVTADNGFQIALNSIYFDHGMPNNATPETVRLLARSGSVGDFTQVFEETVVYPIGTSNVHFELGPVDLTSVFPDPAESFEFRFQVKDQTGGTAPLYRVSRLDNVTLDVSGDLGSGVIGTYRFRDTGSDQPANKSIDSQPTNATFSDFFVVGLTENTLGKESGSANSGWLGTNGWEVGQPGAYGDNKYVGFTFTADSGFEIELNEIRFDMGFANPKSSVDDLMHVPIDIRLLARSGTEGAFTQVFEQTEIMIGSSNAKLELAPVDLASFFPDAAESYEFRFQFKNQDDDRLARLDNVALFADILPTAGLDGDFNGDGMVDAADYVFWRDTNINGPQGYDTWQANFGRSAGAGSIDLAAVPEPASMSLILLAMLTIPVLKVSR